MRTTLDIDDDLLAAARELAQREKKSAGKVVSELMRKALTGAASAGSDTYAKEPEAFYGLRPIPSDGKTVVTNEQIDRLRDELGI